MLVFMVNITEDRSGAIAKMAPLFGADPTQMDDFPHALFGTPAQIAEQLEAARQRWDVSYWIVQADAVDAMAPVVAQLVGT